MTIIKCYKTSTIKLALPALRSSLYPLNPQNVAHSDFCTVSTYAETQELKCKPYCLRSSNVRTCLSWPSRIRWTCSVSAIRLSSGESTTYAEFRTTFKVRWTCTRNKKTNIAELQNSSHSTMSLLPVPQLHKNQSIPRAQKHTPTCTHPPQPSKSSLSQAQPNPILTGLSLYSSTRVSNAAQLSPDLPTHISAPMKAARPLETSLVANETPHLH